MNESSLEGSTSTEQEGRSKERQRLGHASEDTTTGYIRKEQRQGIGQQGDKRTEEVERYPLRKVWI